MRRDRAIRHSGESLSREEAQWRCVQSGDRDIFAAVLRSTPQAASHLSDAEREELDREKARYKSGMFQEGFAAGSLATLDLLAARESVSTCDTCGGECLEPTNSPDDGTPLCPTCAIIVARRLDYPRIIDVLERVDADLSTVDVTPAGQVALDEVEALLVVLRERSSPNLTEEELDFAIRSGLRDAGVKGGLAHLVGPIKRNLRENLLSVLRSEGAGQ